MVRNRRADMVAAWCAIVRHEPDEARAVIFEKWSRCREWLLPAIALTNGTHDEDDILRGLVLGHYMLWAGQKCAVVSEFVEHDSKKKKSCNLFLVGGDMDELLAIEPVIAAWAKEQNCERMTCAGRKGWERVLTDYSFGCVYLYKDL